MKTLVIAEKPSVARDIARVLGCSKKENGALEGNKYNRYLGARPSGDVKRSGRL